MIGGARSTRRGMRFAPYRREHPDGVAFAHARGLTFLAVPISLVAVLLETDGSYAELYNSQFDEGQASRRTSGIG